MSSDDEVAVVFCHNTKKWFVGVVCAQRIDQALEHGRQFDTKDKALVYASRIKNTEYGIQVYE